MTSPKTLRRWPMRNFLAELERSAEDDLDPFDLFVRRELRICRIKARLRLASRKAWDQIDAASRVPVEDLRSELEVAIFESAFNLGFEHGIIAERTGGAGRSRQTKTGQERFRLSIKRLLVEADLPAEDAASALLDFYSALARPLPRARPSLGHSPVPRGRGGWHSRGRDRR